MIDLSLSRSHAPHPTPPICILIGRASVASANQSGPKRFPIVEDLDTVTFPHLTFVPVITKRNYSPPKVRVALRSTRERCFHVLFLFLPSFFWHLGLGSRSQEEEEGSDRIGGGGKGGSWNKRKEKKMIAF